MRQITPKQSLGNWGEETARTYLQKQGLLFMCANWRCKAGEVDLVMREGDTVIFVEVRLRQQTTYGAGYETVSWQKQRKLIKTASWYLQSTNQHHMSVRFDVVSIAYNPNTPNTPPDINHIPHAFAA